MKRVFMILLIAFSPFLFVQAQEEEIIDEEFFEDETMIDPMDEPISAPPTWEAEEPIEPPSSPRPNFPRPSGGSAPPAFGGGTNSGAVEFKLVEPPAYKPAPAPIRVPPKIRQQVQKKVQEAEKKQE